MGTGNTVDQSGEACIRKKQVRVGREMNVIEKKGREVRIRGHHKAIMTGCCVFDL